MRAMEQGLVLCLTCRQANMIMPLAVDQICTRCQSSISYRRKDSIARTWALWITATILYIPANMLPMMSFNSFGRAKPDTIMSGVIELVRHDMWFVGIVVFLASIVVPAVKLIALFLLLYSVQKKTIMSPQKSIWVYRMIEWIGRWSMLDVFVISIFVRLFNFENFASVDAGFGPIAFASVVILTMLAAMTFDPRLIWDNIEPNNDK